MNPCRKHEAQGVHESGAGFFCRICEIERMTAEIEQLQKDLETERMRNVACGVVALANTRDSAKEARTMHPDYESESCRDVANAVDREIQYREAINRAGGLALQKASHEIIRQVLAEGLQTTKDTERKRRLDDLGITEQDIAETKLHWPWELPPQPDKISCSHEHQYETQDVFWYCPDCEQSDRYKPLLPEKDNG